MDFMDSPLQNVKEEPFLKHLKSWKMLGAESDRAYDRKW